MELSIITNRSLNEMPTRRVGDEINAALLDPRFDSFRFAVAFARTSGWSRLALAVHQFVDRGGSVAGAVGIDQRVTSSELLHALEQATSGSVVWHSTSQGIFHPKIYLFSGSAAAQIIAGSSNLTRGGLYTNLELCYRIDLNFAIAGDRVIFEETSNYLSSLIDSDSGQVQRITGDLINALVEIDVVSSETVTSDPEPDGLSAAGVASHGLSELFKGLGTTKVPPSAPLSSEVQSSQDSDPRLFSPKAELLVIQMSAFDSSHRTGVRGTPEVLVPHDAAGFFPPLELRLGRVHPDAEFDVVQDIPTQQPIIRCRFWSYALRSEFRLRTSKEFTDLSNPAGGSLIVLRRRDDPAVPYEMSIVTQDDIAFESFLALCDYTAIGKRWGLA